MVHIFFQNRLLLCAFRVINVLPKHKEDSTMEIKFEVTGAERK
nr:MAG TPA: hypothetical protein [Caudoviricetes sp.]